MLSLSRLHPKSCTKAATLSLCLLVFGLQMSFWWVLIKHNVERAHAARSQMDARVMGLDIRKYTGYFRNYPRSVILGPKRYFDALPTSDENVFQQFTKRPLFGPIFVAVNWPLSLVGFEFPTRMFVALTFFAALSGVLMFILLWNLGWLPAQAVIGSFLGTWSFAWLSTFSLPESHSVTISAAILCLISGQRLVRADRPTLKLALPHALLAGVAAWLYLPLCGAALFVLSVVREPKHWLTIFLPFIIIVVGIAVAPQLFTDLGGVHRQMRYGERYISLSNFLSLEPLRDVSMTFLFFCFVAPVRDFVTSIGRPDWNYIASSWPTIFAVCAMAAGYCWLLWLIISRGLSRELFGVGAWLACLLLFFVIFNPEEVLLYASVPVALIIYSTGVVLGHKRGLHIADHQQRMVSTIALAAGAALLLGLNFRPIWG